MVERWRCRNAIVAASFIGLTVLYPLIIQSSMLRQAALHLVVIQSSVPDEDDDPQSSNNDAGPNPRVASPISSTTTTHEPPNRNGFFSLQHPIENFTHGFYSVARHDRSGSVISDMFKALAYGFVTDATYHGACYPPTKSHSYHNKMLEFRKQHEQLIRGLGLAKLLRFACPRNASMIWPATKYSRLFYRRPDFLRFVRKQIDYASLRNEGLGEVQAAVHVRRGDATPCKLFRRNSMSRYLPNSHYMAIIDRYLPNCTIVPANCSIHIYSERSSHESWKQAALAKRDNVVLHLDGPLSEAWQHFLTADYVILSRSAFSFVPAMLNNNGVVLYTPFGSGALPGWVTVDADIVANTTRVVERMQEALKCAKKK